MSTQEADLLDTYVDTQDVAFGHWMKMVDTAMRDTLGVSVLDIEDRDYWALWASGATPHHVVDDVILQYVDEPQKYSCC